MTITDAQIDAWLEYAKKATQGKWIEFDYKVIDDMNKDIVCISRQDTNHIANMCPANAIQILEELKELRKYASQLEYAYVDEVMK